MLKRIFTSACVLFTAMVTCYSLIILLLYSADPESSLALSAARIFLFFPFALAFSAAECGGGLSELDVSQSHVLYGLYLAQYVGHVFEEFHCLVYGHVEHVGDALPLVSHFERLAVVAFAMAHLTGHHHIGQEIHLYCLVSVATAGFAASALYVEGEASGLVASDFGFGQVYEHRPDVAEHSRVCGGV